MPRAPATKASKPKSRSPTICPRWSLATRCACARLLENLADNAVKFTHEGTVVLTAAAKPAGRKRVQLIFTVADTGIGIDARDIKKSLSPIRAGERGGGAPLWRRRPRPGVFVKRVAEALGGRLAVTSEPGHGTSFRLRMPVDRVKVSAQTERAGVRAAATRPLSILCAEDNPYGRVVMNTILSELGHRADFVESGEAAVDAVSRGSYDAVLMDVVLDGLDGIAATRRIRALTGKAGTVPVIGISGRTESGEEAAARAAGMNFYLLKPVSPGEVGAGAGDVCRAVNSKMKAQRATAAISRI